MKRKRNKTALGFMLFVALLVGASSLAGVAGAQEVADTAAAPAVSDAGSSGSGNTAEIAGYKLNISGYLREHVSFNLQDPPETKQNDRWDVSMARTTLQAEASLEKSGIRFQGIGRVVGEMKTDYLKRLDALPGQTGALMDQYNVSELRELYAEFSPISRTQVRVGKQQIVWGETDFFQAMDIVQGFDFTWRSFLEGENEDYRKPLILANVLFQVPELNGTMQVYLRPALDRDKDIGNTYDLFGGRWANQPNKGVNFYNLPDGTPLVPYNFHHRDGNVSDVTYGARWAGSAGPVNYSLAYLRIFGPNPVVNSATHPYESTTTAGILGEFIYPKYDVFGLTASAAVDSVDAVFSTEITYTKDQFFNVGSQVASDVPIPGWGGIIKKDTVRFMVRMDKQLALMDLLGTSQASFFSVQFFDTWIQDFKKSDDMVDLAGYGAPKKEHSGLVTAVLGLNYMNGRVNPQLAGGYDTSYGGGFLIPSLSLAFGDKWRFNTEADLFFAKKSKGVGQMENSTHLLGYFANNNQLMMRLTRLF
ncbi:MAG: DUF1302 family protein [Desulfobacteria bacterium]